MTKSDFHDTLQSLFDDFLKKTPSADESDFESNISDMLDGLTPYDADMCDVALALNLFGVTPDGTPENSTPRSVLQLVIDESAESYLRDLWEKHEKDAKDTADAIDDEVDGADLPEGYMIEWDGDPLGLFTLTLCHTENNLTERITNVFYADTDDENGTMELSDAIAQLKSSAAAHHEGQP